MHNYHSWNGPQWLLDIAIRIDEWLQEKPSAMRRFRQMVRQWSDDTHGEEGLGFPTWHKRALRLTEQYAATAAIHNRPRARRCSQAGLGGARLPQLVRRREPAFEARVVAVDRERDRLARLG